MARVLTEPQQAAERLLDDEDEDVRVTGWRLQCFLAAGCPAEQAELLAMSDADRGLVERALRAGIDAALLVTLLL